MTNRADDSSPPTSGSWAIRAGIPLVILILAASAFLVPWKTRNGISAADWFQGWASVVGAIIGALSALLILSISLVTQNRQHAKQLEVQQTLHNGAMRQQETNHREQLEVQRELHAREMSYVRNQENLKQNTKDTLLMDMEVTGFFQKFNWWNGKLADVDATEMRRRMVEGQVAVRSAVFEWLGSSGVDLNTGMKFGSMIFQCIEIYIDATLSRFESIRSGSEDDADTIERIRQSRDWVVNCTQELFVNMNVSPHEKQSIVSKAVREYFSENGLVRYMKNADVFDYEPKPWRPQDPPRWSK